MTGEAAGRGAPRIAALVGPLLLVGAMASALYTPAVEGLPPLSEVATGARLAEVPRDTTVLIVGNSQAFSAVDPAALGQALGIPGKAATATLAGLNAVGAWTILRHRMFGAGYRPKVVVLPISTSHLLDVHPPDPVNLARLYHHLPGRDEVLDRKVFGAADVVTPDAVRRMYAAATTSRDAWLGDLTSAPLRLVGVADPASRMDAARDRVLGEVAGANLATQVQTMPSIGVAARAPAPAAAAGGLDIDATLLPDLVALCAEHGARLVVASVPQQATRYASDAATTRALASWLADHQVPFLPLENLAIPGDGWLDVAHLSGAGTVAYTAALASQLQQLGALGDGPISLPALPGAPPVIRRTGALPAVEIVSQSRSEDGCGLTVQLARTAHRSDTQLGALGLGHASPIEARVGGVALTPHVSPPKQPACLGQTWHAGDTLRVSLPAPGAEPTFTWAEAPSTRRESGRADVPLREDVLWVPPGSAVDFTWQERPTADRIEVVAITIGPAAQGTPQVDLGSATVTMTALGRLWHAELPVAGGAITSPLTLSSPAGGPELLVLAVRLHRAGGAEPAFGSVTDLPWTLAIAGALTTDAEPPFPDEILARDGVRKDDKLFFKLSGPLTALTQTALAEMLDDSRFKGCFPLGLRDPTTGALRDGVVQTEPGKLVAREVPPETGDAWEVVWRSKRTCYQRGWVLPGEAVTFKSRLPRSLAVPADTLKLDVVTVPPGATVQVSVRVDDQVVLDAPVNTSIGRYQTLPLAATIAPAPASVQLIVTAPAGVYATIGRVDVQSAAAAALWGR